MNQDVRNSVQRTKPVRSKYHSRCELNLECISITNSRSAITITFTIIIIEMIQMVDLKYLHLHICMESLEIKQQIPLANLTWRSALPICLSIAISLSSLIEIINTITVGDCEILSLSL